MSPLAVSRVTGASAFRFAQRTAAKAEEANIPVCHLNLPMLEQGRRLLEVDAANISWVCGDAEDLPFEDASQDAYTIAFGIRNTTHLDDVLAEAYRVLKPGGGLAILEFAVPTMPVFGAFYTWYTNRVLPRIGRALSRNDSAYAYLPASISAFATPEEFVKILRHAGFTAISPVRLMLGSVILYTARRD